MKITAIKQQVKNPERASIFVDGKYSFSLGLSDLVAEKLRMGQEIDESNLKRLKKLSEDGKLKMRALEWVLSRPRSKREFRDYMFRKKADPDMVDKLIDDFAKSDYLNEQNFATWLADVRRRRGKSDKAIKSELASKGLGRELIDEILASYEGEDSEINRLNKLIQKKKNHSAYKNDQNKLMHYLARQGFSYEDIKRCLND